jgi:hypothetical protein
VEYRRTTARLLLNPNELLKPYTLYTMVVEGTSADNNGATLAVADEAGNPMTQTHAFTFTTGEGHKMPHTRWWRGRTLPRASGRSRC